jgi:hypothetical protein
MLSGGRRFAGFWYLSIGAAMNKLTVAMGLVGLAVFGACGETKHPPITDPESSAGKSTLPRGGRSNGTGGTGATDGGQGGASSDDTIAEGVTVTILTPAAADDPVEDEVLVEDDVLVTCRAVADDPDKPVDPSTVVIEVLNADGEVATGVQGTPLSAKGAPTGDTDEYSAMFSLLPVATGRVRFRCSASGVDTEVKGASTLRTFVDHGPTITPSLPKEASAHSLEAPLAVEFTVAPSLLSDEDTEADVTSVKLIVAGVEIEDLDEDSAKPGTYHASVNFADRLIFDKPPMGNTSVRIEALNARTSAVATAVLEYSFVVDGAGPEISFKSPRANDTINGDTVIAFTAKDVGAGLDEDTLEVAVTGMSEPVKFDPTSKSVWGRQGDDFTFRFDTGVLEDIESQVTVSIRAKDRAGNLTDGVTRFLYLDERPPFIDLDPGLARGFDGQGFCSKSFDPLGDALNDGAKTKVRSNLFRVLIYDDTNGGSGQDVTFLSGTNKGSARLYFQPDTSQPILKDSNGDGRCDELAREDFKYIALTPIGQAGALSYSTTDYAAQPAVDKDGSDCKLKDSEPAPQLCPDKTSDMSVVVRHDAHAGVDMVPEEVVYGAGDLNALECTGPKLDLKSYASPNGWVCLAARAVDNLGNVGVSRPLRVCFDDPADSVTPECMTDGAVPPSCTTACTPPAPFPAHVFRFR